MIKNKHIGYFLGIIVGVSFVMSCSKKDISAGGATTSASKTTTNLLDSIYLYASQLYYWYDKLPSASQFNTSRFASGSSSDSTNGTNEIFAISRYAVNPSTGKSYEYYFNGKDTFNTKYSYLEGKDADQNAGSSYKSYVTLAGWGNDLGLYGPILYGDSSLVFRMFYENGPAYNAGLRRGNCLIYKINGKTFNNTNDLTTIENAINSSSISLTYWDTLNISHDVTFTQNRYSSNPIFADTVWTVGSKTIGYFGFLNFADPDIVETKLNTLFSEFSNKGVTDLIVDLRYNGGGYVATSAQLANLIASNSLNGQLMFTENYNSLLQSGKVTLQNAETKKSYGSSTEWSVSNQTFNFSSTSSSLNLSKICFIVSDETASASELLINNLKPYKDVKLIGTTITRATNYLPTVTTTYGKPVGFFPIPIGNFDVYLAEFESRNSTNTAVSYSGMTCDITDWDDFLHNFTNRKEDAVAQAINYITNGAFLTTRVQIGGKSSTSNSSSNVFGSVLSYRGAVGTSTTSQPVIKSINSGVGQLPTHLGMIEKNK